MIKRLFVPFILFMLVILEGAAIDLLPASLKYSEIVIVPHWVLMFLVLITLFYNAEESFEGIVYAIIFGLLIDIVYTEILGVYMITYSIAIYAVFIMKRLLQANWYMTTVIAIIALVITECLLGFVYSIINIAEPLSLHFFKYRLLPTILANVIFVLILYPINKQLTKWKSAQLEN